MRRLLSWLVTDADRRAIESELAELYEVRRREDGDVQAAKWLRRQRSAYARKLMAERLRGAIAGATSSLPHLGRDLAYSVRSLIRTPGLAATIILTVGLGLGATTAMVSVVRAVLVSPLPYADASNIFWLYTDNPPFRFRWSLVDYRALEADHPALSEVAAYTSSRVTITDAGSADRVNAKQVTGSYFPLMRQAPALGRLFDATDDARNERVAVLTHAYWTRRFAADPAVLGRALTIDGASHTIVGVLERSDGPLERDLALFTMQQWAVPKRKGPFLWMVFGRLKPGVPLAAAGETLRATNARLFPIWKSSYQDEKATWGLQDLQSRVVGTVGSTLMLVLAAVGCVLLIACANAVNLLIARALGRSRELAIRGALGASRGRLLQHLLAETAVLTGGAAVVGVAVAAGAMALVTEYGAGYIPRVDEVRLSGAALAWLAALAAASGLIIGVVPAIHSARLKMNRALAAGGRSGGEARPARRLRRLLVAAEFALATPLLVAAALVTVSLDRLARVDVGLDTDRLLTAAVSLSGRYPSEEARAAFWTRTLDRLAALPGVDAVALSDSRPPREAGQRNNFDLIDKPTPPGRNQPTSPWVGVSLGFFKTAGLSLQRGSLFDESSLQQDVVLVDRSWANRFFPGEEVVGRRLRSGGCTTCDPTTVIGVVDNVKWVGLDATEDGTVYFPFVDMPNAYLVLRTGGDPAGLANGVRQAMTELDPELAVSNIATGSELVDGALATPRYLSVVVGMFGIAALVLSIVGIHGVMAHFVQQHTRDLGIRLALGGDPGAMRRMVILQGVALVGVGVAVGMTAALLSMQLMSSVLFGVSANDPRILAGIPVALLLVAVAACALPARRAARLDPATILRES
jgi:putative ABC transport system permease protein